jgi:hypothetical protein
MNKDTLNGILKYNRGAEKEIARLREENIKLQQRIDKAIEYIEKNKKTISKGQAKDTRLQIGTFMWNIDSLLNILRGEDNE